MTLRVASLITAVLAASLAIACDGDTNGESVTSPTPTHSTADPEPRVGAVEAVRRYVDTTGLDGDSGRFSDPSDCETLGDDVNGDYCIVEPSIYAPALVLLLVADVDDRQSRVWQVRTVFEDGEWQVVDTIKFEDPD